MRKIKGYANFGVLSKEKQVIFTVGNPHVYSTFSEKVEICLPDGWDVGENFVGDTLIISPDGKVFLASDVILSYRDNPVIDIYTGEYGSRITLDWCII